MAPAQRRAVVIQFRLAYVSQEPRGFRSGREDPESSNKRDIDGSIGDFASLGAQSFQSYHGEMSDGQWCIVLIRGPCFVIYDMLSIVHNHLWYLRQRDVETSARDWPAADYRAGNKQAGMILFSEEIGHGSLSCRRWSSEIGGLPTQRESGPVREPRAPAFRNQTEKSAVLKRGEGAGNSRGFRLEMRKMRGGDERTVTCVGAGGQG